MRILLDEDVALQALQPLQHVLRNHVVDHVHSLGWSGKKDLFVLRDAAAQQFEVLITNDGRQLDDPDGDGSRGAVCITSATASGTTSASRVWPWHWAR